tara:strand:- start:1636 stop:2394 length:759 start_codon:yes stop_codon:yes gene_type:complete
MIERIAVIDADILLYKACRVSEEEVNWGDDQWVLWADLNKVKTIIDDQVDLLVDEINADRSILCFSDKKNYRKEVNPEYKANRRGGRKPLCFTQALEYCKDTYPFRQLPNLEADDVIGIIATCESGKPDEYIIVSEDKDLLTIPGLHWDLKHKKIYPISKKEADFNFFSQTLKGDAVDNYKGCPNVGKVTAEKLLQDAQKKGEDLWKTVVKRFEKAGLTEEDAILNARMARILRATDYNREQSTVNLWKGDV